jgi:hypothetical protein
MIAKFRLFSQGSFATTNYASFMSEVCVITKSQFYTAGELVVAKGAILEGMFCIITGKVVKTAQILRGSLRSNESNGKKKT